MSKTYLWLHNIEKDFYKLVQLLRETFTTTPAQHVTMVGEMVQNSQSLYSFTFSALIDIHEYIYSHSTTEFTFKKYICSHLPLYFLGYVHNNPFSNENAAVLLRFRKDLRPHLSFSYRFARHTTTPDLKTLLYPQCACSNELDACAFQYNSAREIGAKSTW